MISRRFLIISSSFLLVFQLINCQFNTGSGTPNYQSQSGGLYQNQQNNGFGINYGNGIGNNYGNGISGSQQNPNRGLFNNQAITPINTTSLPTNSNKGVTIQFQLRGYSNPSSALPNSNMCTCPASHSCSFLKTSPRCYFAFTFIISTPDESVRYHITDFYYLDHNGQLPQNSQGSWSQNYVMQLPSKPSAIDVFAHHLGAVITQNGQLVQDDTLTHVDTFVVPLTDTLPAVEGVQNMNQQKTYQGKLLGTSLTMSFSVSCSGKLIGPACDFTCVPSEINSNIASCESNTTGFFSICNYISGGQVDHCKNCPWGIREGTYCQDENGAVLDPKEAGLVGSGWQTATIILAIILFIFSLIFCASIVFTCAKHRRRPVEKELTTFKPQRSLDDREPLHQKATYRQENNSARQGAMLPPPQMNEPKPIKSALRKPSYTPLTDDSSFASDIPIRPSRSEVV